MKPKGSEISGVADAPENRKKAASACSRGMLIFTLSALPLLTMAQSTDVPVPAPGTSTGQTQSPIVPVRPVRQRNRALEDYQREEFIRNSRQTADSLRKRVVLPQSALANVQDATAAGLHASESQVATVIHSAFYDNLMHTLLMMVLAMGGAIIIARKFVPELGEYLNNYLQPWRLMPAAPGDSSVHLMAEEKSVAEFHANFLKLARVEDTTPPFGSGDVAGGGALVANSLYSRALEFVHDVQRMLSEVNLCTDERKQRALLREIAGKLGPLKKLAEAPDLRPVWQIVSAVELLLKRLSEKEGSINSSVLRTIGQANAVLTELCRPGLNPNLLVDPPLRVLVVDDEAFSRFALCQSLERTLNKPEIADSATKALALAAENAYDLIFLDVLMPDMDGFELCPKIHEIEKNSSTPVVFVTSLSDAKSRAQSVISGGRDFLTKPFLTFEVTVKALTLVTRERLRGRRVAKVAAAQPVLEPVS